MSWYGRKATFLPWLLPLLPTADIDTFVDAFGGSGSVICSRQPVARNIYADRDQQLVDLFGLLQDRAAAERLVAALRLTPWHRAEYDRALGGRSTDTPHERSRQFLVWAVQRAIMTADAAWRFHRRAHTTDILRPWAAVADELLAIQPATECLTVLHRDGLAVSHVYDSPSTLHYFDPPYLGFDTVYQHRFDRAEHQRLAHAAHHRTGRVTISGYRTPEYDRWFRGWYRWDHPTARECLWTNYAP